MYGVQNLNVEIFNVKLPIDAMKNDKIQPIVPWLTATIVAASSIQAL